jgi:hypothetical protein
MSLDLFPAELVRARHVNCAAPGMEPGAVFSACGRRRYLLCRHVGSGSRIACFAMLNPSVADAVHNDNTIARCIGFAQLWGCGWLVVVNLFPWISTDPLALYKAPEQLLDPKNRDYFVRAAHAAHDSGGPVVCAWGAHGGLIDQDLVALAWLRRDGIPAQCLGTTADGYPRHPGRIAYTTPLDPYPGRGRQGG